MKAAIQPSRRAFMRAQRDARLARQCRAQARRTACPWQRAGLYQTARQCEARVRFMADQALRGAR
jgi:hypothetical protein